MNRLHALSKAIQQGIGRDTVAEDQIHASLERVFSADFLAQRATEEEFHKARTLARSTPWANEIKRLMGADNG